MNNNKPKAKLFKKNIGNDDKTLRFTIGIIIVVFGWYMKTWLALIGLVFIITAFVGICPAYMPFGFSTAKKDKK